MTGDLVSVVVPSFNRSSLVTRAVKSALSQTCSLIEVIVVVDGPDRATLDALSQVGDSRLRTIQLTERAGGSKARNIGVQNAKGKWVAFLDDDDEWFPQKIESQIKLALMCNKEYPIITCRLVGRTPDKNYVWPRRLPGQSEDIGDYLFVRKELLKGEALIQTSTILTKKKLLLKFPFNEKLRKHQDTEWIISVSRDPSTSIMFVDEPLVIWNIEDERSTVSSKLDWHYTLAWLLENKSRLSARAFASFILTQLSAEASQEKDYRAIWKLLHLAFTEGKPGPLDLALFAGMWVVPRHMRRRIRANLS
jgi:glycosyltransferase involved in cell wall biosynthesis